jgi:hypothetical protein
LFISAAEEWAEWSQMVLTFGPKNEQVQKVYNGSKVEIAQKHGVSRPASHMTTWFKLIEHDEGRM